MNTVSHGNADTITGKVLAHLRTIYSKSAIPTLVTEASGTIPIYNAAMRKLTGYSHKDCPDIESCAALVFTDKAERKKAVTCLELGDNAVEECLTVTRKNGSQRLVALHASKSAVADSNVVLCVAHCLDVTYNRDIEDKLVRETIAFNSIVDLNPYSISFYDAEGYYIRGNQAYLDLFKSWPPSNYSIFTDPILEKCGYKNVLARVKKGEIVRIPEIWYNPHHLRKEFPDMDLLVRGLCIPVKDGKGDIQYYIVMHEDITASVKAEKALLESEEHYKTIYDNVPISIWKYDFSDALSLKNKYKSRGIRNYRKYLKNHPEIVKEIIASLKVIDVNEETLKLYGARSKGEIINSFGKRLLPDTIETFREIIAAYMEEKKHCECEAINETLDGRFINIIFRITFPEQENFEKIALATVTDITKRKQIEELLIESEMQYRTMIDSLGNPIHVIDRDFRIQFTNEAFTARCKDIEIDSDAVGKNIFDVFPFLSEKVRDEYRQVFDTGKLCITEENTFFHNKHFITETRKIPILDDRETIRVLTVLRDITEQKKMEEALRESEERYRMIFDVVPVSILEYDYSKAITLIDEMQITYKKQYRKVFEQKPDLFEQIIANIHLIDVNGETVRLYKATSKKEYLDSFGKYETPESLETFRNAIYAYFDGNDSYMTETVNRTLDGKLIHILYRVIFNRDKSLAGRAIVTAVDITARKKSEEALRQSEESYRHIAELSPFPISIIDSTGRFLYINERFIDVFGYTIDEVPTATKFVRRAFPNPAYRRKFLLAWKTGLEDILKGRIIVNTFTVRCKDGTNREITFRPVIIGENSYYMTYEDITDRIRVEEERLKVSKLESLGLLAGGIAHDFNNILTAILGNISLAKTYVSEDNVIFKSLTKSENACFRAQDLTQQLLTFSRGGAPIRETESITEIIEESANFSLLGSNVRCDFDIAENLFPVHVDKGQISQVINNLIINADQAMPNGGYILVKIENIYPKPMHLYSLEAERLVKISIRDEGIGISKEHMSKIYDPYFTTKEKGRGLGLASAYAIIKRHGGYITVESEIGIGTTFTVYLPAREIPDKPKDIVIPKHSGSIDKRGRILVMDDDSGIRNLLAEMLRILGQKSVLSSNGEEAIILYTEALKAGKPFDLVIMDLTVPGGMGGRETIEKLLVIDPEIKAVVSSGYSNDPVLAHYEDFGFKGIISKPYRFEQLKQVVIDIMFS